MGWLGYPDEKIRRACREGIEQGFSRFELKVGLDLGDDLRRTALVRDMIGPEHTLMIDGAAGATSPPRRQAHRSP
ncbi:enolase C-terminal domain-like protein [Sorangium sp. So ce145]|uniref:enolase C-terminal domain-like protein n=1 Tax=Sorangium sp. So ce145 TaxID=3133285 RepID=UPI003F6403EC